MSCLRPENDEEFPVLAGGIYFQHSEAALDDLQDPSCVERFRAAHRYHEGALLRQMFGIALKHRLNFEQGNIIDRLAE